MLHLSHAGGGVDVQIYLLGQLQHRDVVGGGGGVVALMCSNRSNADPLFCQGALTPGLEVVLPEYDLHM